MEFRKYRHIASWRSRAYPYLAEKYDLKESSIRSAASRAGLTSKAASLNHIFSVKEEEPLLRFAKGRHVNIGHLQFLNFVR